MPEWLLLIHQLPPTPNYLRVKVARRMQRIGAVAIKNTVYALPATESALEDFQWTVREIRAEGGEANLFEARVIEGLSDGEIQQLFKSARDEEYEAIASEARSLDREDRQRLVVDIARLRKRIADVQSIDFFGAPKGQRAVAVVEELARTIEEPAQASSEAESSEAYRNRIWVTRAGVHVDRMASAWLQAPAMAWCCGSKTMPRTSPKAAARDWVIDERTKTAHRRRRRTRR